MSTKLRALFQRNKGRDLFDLWVAVKKLNVDCRSVIELFKKYNEPQNIRISRAEFEKNLYYKMQAKAFVNDIRPLLEQSEQWQPENAYQVVMNNIISLLPGEVWRGVESEII